MVNELRTLKTKHRDLQKDLTNLQKQPRATLSVTTESEPSTRDTTPGTSAQGEQGKKKKAKIPDPPIFQNDGSPTWEDWYVDMKVKLKAESTWDEDEKMGYILSRTGKNPRALIQTGYLADKYNTAQDMMQTLTKAFNDPHKKAKARAMYRNLRMGEQERFDTFISKFTTYAAQAEITDDAMLREDLFEKVTKTLRDSVRSNLHLNSTFYKLQDYIGLIFWELEAEKKRTPRTAQAPVNKPASSPSSARPTPSRTTANTAKKDEKEKPTYLDKRKADLSAKGACFNCEQTGHMVKDCPKKDIKALEVNEESEKEDP